MSRSISHAVGQGGRNLPPDTVTVQTLLNQVPPVVPGAPLVPLKVDGLCGPKTTGAIRWFQQHQFGHADARVDTHGPTLARLNEYDRDGGNIFISSPPVRVRTEVRQRVIEIALAQSDRAVPPNGKVSDLDTVPEPGSGRSVRRGWAELKSYFDIAWAGWTQDRWLWPGYLDGVKVPGKRVPQPDYTKKDGTVIHTGGIQWCGVFATWVFIQAGVDVKWSDGKPTLRPHLGSERGVRPGDIGVVKAGNHHFIVVDIDGNKMVTVNGNAEYQSIKIHDGGSVSKIETYYRLEDAPRISVPA